MKGMHKNGNDINEKQEKTIITGSVDYFYRIICRAGNIYVFE